MHVSEIKRSTVVLDMKNGNKLCVCLGRCVESPPRWREGRGVSRRTEMMSLAILYFKMMVVFFKHRRAVFGSAFCEDNCILQLAVVKSIYTEL